MAPNVTVAEVPIKAITGQLSRLRNHAFVCAGLLASRSFLALRCRRNCADDICVSHSASSPGLSTSSSVACLYPAGCARARLPF
eukprot:5017469-Pleurochrysis_carterae.AAC.1